MDDGRRIGDQVARREAAIGTGICADCGKPCPVDEGLCRICREPRRARLPETNPYRKVWNAVEDEEAHVLAAVRNNTLFVPTPEIIAERHRRTARHKRERAAVGAAGAAADFLADIGLPLKAIRSREEAHQQHVKLLEDAVIHDHCADEMDLHQARINDMKRAKVFSFTVKEVL